MTTESEKKIIYSFTFLVILSLSFVILTTYTLNRFYKWFIASLMWLYLGILVGCHMYHGCNVKILFVWAIIICLLAFVVFAMAKLMGWEQQPPTPQPKLEEKKHVIYL
jgi:hypothetical protein